jgi:hypothetical protein
MHHEILTSGQIELLPLIRQFKREFYLVGGTAIALHLGHRRSVDFDLFKSGVLKHRTYIDKLSDSGFEYMITRRVTEQLNLTINGVKVTFFQYPFVVQTDCIFDDIIKLPGLVELAAMKAYALGRRSKWKDYVDLYFILKDHLSINQISMKATEIFGQLYSEKLFRSQLSYFEDVDYSEPVEFLHASVPEIEIRKFLIAKAIEIIP